MEPTNQPNVADLVQEAKDAEAALNQALSDAQSVTTQNNPNVAYAKAVASRVQDAANRVAAAITNLSDHPDSTVDTATVETAVGAAQDVEAATNIAQTATDADSVKSSLSDVVSAAQDVQAGVSDAVAQPTNVPVSDQAVPTLSPVDAARNAANAQAAADTQQVPNPTPDTTLNDDVTANTPPTGAQGNVVSNIVVGGDTSQNPNPPLNVDPNASVPVPQAVSPDAPQVNPNDVGVLNTNQEVAPADVQPSHGKSYTVQAGDTLDAIARENEIPLNDLYLHNIVAIETAAINHGEATSRAGALLYPGIELVIPHFVNVEVEE